jgi:hypothetical protein
MKLFPSCLFVVAVSASPFLVGAQVSTDLNAKRLELLRTATARMIDTESVGRDSCLHVRMRTTTVPLEGDRTVGSSELYQDARSMWFTSDHLKEYATTQEHVRIWPSDRLVMISKSDSRALLRTRELMNEVNQALSQYAKVIRAEDIVLNGERILRMELQVYSQALNGWVDQTVEVYTDRQVIRSVEIVLPTGHPLRRCTVEYLVFEKIRKPGIDPFIHGLLAQRGPVNRYRDHDVKDLRNSK